MSKERNAGSMKANSIPSDAVPSRRAASIAPEPFRRETPSRERPPRAASPIRRRPAPRAEDEMEDTRVAEVHETKLPVRPRLIMLCREPAESPLWGRIRQQAAAIARGDVEVHLYCSEAVDLDPRVRTHVVGSGGGDLLEQSRGFARRVSTGLDDELRGSAVPALAFEWGAIPALLELGERRRVISLESLERQRSGDLEQPLSKAIDEIERTGLTRAQHIVIRDQTTAQLSAVAVPGCGERLVHEHWVFPRHELAPCADPGEVKARYQVGPVDPTILYIGDLDDRHGAELLIKAMPAVLKNHPQARLILVGDGELLWPLRVQSRYLLLDHAVRIVGDVGGQAVRELVAAADIIAVPSRDRTEQWPILAGWATGRPVVATHEVAGHFCVHEDDCVLVYSNAGSCVWGIERVLYDGALAEHIGRRGGERLDAMHGWTAVGGQLRELLFPEGAAPQV